MCDSCSHLRPPLAEALAALRSPLSWQCKVCGSTDGVWVCLHCGHVGCGRRANHPELGGGHSRHHYLTCGHECVIDVVSKAVHCYKCDDWLLCDEPWLATLRAELEALELQVPAAAAGEAAGEPHAPLAGPLPPGCTGLLNLGNTCYMNSVLQALSHCAGFRSFFRDFIKHEAPLAFGLVKIQRQTTEGHLVRAEAKRKPAQLEISAELHSLLRVCWSGRWRSAAPHAFVHAVWTHGNLFAARRQQDAQEFLGFLLDRLDEELFPNQASALMAELFGIEQRQAVLCAGCGTVSERSEQTLGLVLSLPPPDAEAAAASGWRGRFGAGQAVPLQSCFDAMLAAENMHGSNQFHCDVCGKLQDATRRLSLHRQPQALLLSFRRTCYSARRGVHKDARPVAFPFEFNAAPLLHPGPAASAATSSSTATASYSPAASAATAPAAAAPAAAQGPRMPPITRRLTASSSATAAAATPAGPSCLYRLAAVVSHAGESAQKGHYVAYARGTPAPAPAPAPDAGPSNARKRPRHGRSDGNGGGNGGDGGGGGARDSGEWFLFNDARVTRVSDQAVLRAEAFILLYERQV